MMMNDFGVPMNDAEMSMQPPGAIKPHERMMAESGVQSNVIGDIIDRILVKIHQN